MPRSLSAGVLLAGFVILAGCDDPTGFNLNPILVSGEATISAPLPQNAGLPSALDVTSDGELGVNGARFPERIRDALEWDFAVRVREGEVVLIPARGIGVRESQAALTPAIEGETFESLREAPGQRTFTRDSAVVMRVGRVYAARSREMTAGAFGFGCYQFSKFEPTSVDVATGTLSLRIVTNERCGDPRLVRVD